MIPWKQAYERQASSEQFRRWFWKNPNVRPPMEAFRYLAYTLPFNQVPASATAGLFGATVGPLNQPFPAGAIILGITATAFQAQTAAGAFQYAPTTSPGRRDQFGLSFQYAGDEQITPDGLTLADALMGSGEDTIFPGREIVMPPSQALLVGCASMTNSAALLTVHVVFHTMVPRAVS